MTESNKTFLIYESGNVDEARARANRGVTVVCLDFFVECELQKRNIPFVSIRDILLSVESIEAETIEEEWYVLAHEVAREWYRLPAMNFFEHNGIRLAEAPEPIMGAYLGRLFYYVRICIALKKTYSSSHFSIPAFIVEDTQATNCLLSFECLAVADAARMVGLESTVVGQPVAPGKRPFLRTVWKSLLLCLYNTFISFAPHHGFKIYASEYWSHIGSAIERMDDGELVLMESEEIKHIPWRQLLKHRVRIRHPANRKTELMKRIAIQRARTFMKQWEVVKKDVAHYLSSIRGELDWSPILEVCEHLIARAPRVIADIDALHCIMNEEKPNVVLQLASLGLHHSHSFLMARVAAQLGIPSVELQHAGVTIDPRSIYSRIETEYLATYGTDVNVWHERIGHAPGRLIAVGSPRFDQYVNERTKGIEKGKQLFTQLGLDTSRPILLTAVPFSGPYTNAVDSYQLAEFFETIRTVQNKVPGLQVILKFRNDKHIDTTQRKYLKNLFQTDCVLVRDEDIFALLCACDAVVCNNSTVIYQAVLAQKPLVLYPWKIFDSYHAQIYAPTIPLFYTAKEAVDSISRVFTDASYREELLARQKQFLKGYSFDGKSSERVAKLLRDLPSKSRK